MAGKLVYELHHEPSSHGVSVISPSSLQLLHIAAHVDAIENRIAPVLREGKTVVLDRFWWSTQVYGMVSGVPRPVLDGMIEIELAAWNPIRPTCLFLITRQLPLRPEPADLWKRW